MEDSEIVNINLEQVIPDAVNGNQQALDLLMCCEWMMQLLSRIAEWARCKKQIDVDIHGRDIQDIVSDRIRLKIKDLRNPRNTSWRACLETWSFKVARTCCENVRERKRAEQRYRTSVEHEHTQRRQDGVRIVEPCSTMMSQQEEIEQKEQAPLQDRLTSRIRRTMREVSKTFTPEDKIIMSLWLENKTLMQIATEIDSSTETVRRKLKKLQDALYRELTKVIIKEVGEERFKENGVAQVLEELLTHRNDLRELLIHNSLETTPSNQAPSVNA
jgi:RNA polymerase sigma factor (sigma-70 family)